MTERIMVLPYIVKCTLTRIICKASRDLIKYIYMFYIIKQNMCFILNKIYLYLCFIIIKVCLYAVCAK